MAGDKIAQAYKHMITEARKGSYDAMDDESPDAKAYRRGLEAHHEMEHERKEHEDAGADHPHAHDERMVQYHREQLENSRPRPDTFHHDTMSFKDRRAHEALHRAAIKYYQGDKSALTPEQHQQLADMHRSKARSLRAPVMHANTRSLHNDIQQADFHAGAAEHHAKMAGSHYAKPAPGAPHVPEAGAIKWSPWSRS